MVTDKQEFVTISEAARLIGVSRQTIYDRIKARKLFPLRIMGLPYIPTSQLLIKKAKGG